MRKIYLLPWQPVGRLGERFCRNDFFTKIPSVIIDIEIRNGIWTMAMPYFGLEREYISKAKMLKEADAVLINSQMSEKYGWNYYLIQENEVDRFEKKLKLLM